MKTNAARALDSMGINYKLCEYGIPIDQLDAELFAKRVDLAVEQIFKTLVVQGENNKVYLVVVPIAAQLDFKALAECTKDRKLHLAALDQVQNLTGYVRGSVTSLACKTTYPVYVDESINALDTIGVSAGAPEMELILSAKDYLKATKATTHPIATQKKSHT